jgi:hypothetical protein
MFKRLFKYLFHKKIKEPEQLVKDCMNCRNRFQCASSIIRDLPDEFYIKMGKVLYDCLKNDRFTPESYQFDNNINHILKNGGIHHVSSLEHNRNDRK